MRRARRQARAARGRPSPNRALISRPYFFCFWGSSRPEWNDKQLFPCLPAGQWFGCPPPSPREPDLKQQWLPVPARGCRHAPARARSAPPVAEGGGPGPGTGGHPDAPPAEPRDESRARAGGKLLGAGGPGPAQIRFHPAPPHPLPPPPPPPTPPRGRGPLRRLYRLR